VTRGLLRLARLPVLLTLGAVVAYVVLDGRLEAIVHLYALALATYALAHLVAAVRRANPAAGPSRFEAALRPRPSRPERLPELEQAEREVALGIATAFDLHYRLRPSLRRIAGELLAARRAIDLDTQPEAARRALGEEAWELVRGDREPPSERYGRGIRLERLEAVVASLEAL
jgi:hypothetical protein